MNGKKLSIIVPVYNAEKYVKECINSLYEQSELEIEVISINDGSTDNSLQALYKLKEEYPDLIIINQNNMGVSVARNKGLSVATGDYITFVDADDTIEKNAYSYIIKNMLNSNADISIFAFRRCLAGTYLDCLLPWENLEILTSNRIRRILIPLMFSSIDNKSVISGSVCRSVFKAELIKSLSFNEEVAMQEDLLFCIFSYNKAERIQIINYVKYNYIKHNVTTTEKYRHDFYCESLHFEEMQINALKDIGIFNEIISQYQNKRMDMYSLCISNLFRFDAPDDISKQLKQIINGFKSDTILSNINLKQLSLRNTMLYILLSLRSKNILKFIYKNKEIKRRSKLAN